MHKAGLKLPINYNPKFTNYIQMVHEYMGKISTRIMSDLYFNLYTLLNLLFFP